MIAHLNFHSDGNDDICMKCFGISHSNDNTSVYIVQSADREIRLLFPEYFNEGLSVQKSMEDMEDDHRLVGGERKDVNLFIYFIYLETQFKIDKSKLGRRNGTFATNTRRMFCLIFIFIFFVSFVYSCCIFCILV